MTIKDSFSGNTACPFSSFFKSGKEAKANMLKKLLFYYWYSLNWGHFALQVCKVLCWTYFLAEE